jgi:hypothetical protein
MASDCGLVGIFARVNLGAMKISQYHNIAGSAATAQRREDTRGPWGEQRRRVFACKSSVGSEFTHLLALEVPDCRVHTPASALCSASKRSNKYNSRSVSWMTLRRAEISE